MNLKRIKLIKAKVLFAICIFNDNFYLEYIKSVRYNKDIKFILKWKI